MRPARLPLLLLLCALAPACDKASAVTGVGVGAAVTLGSVAVLGRTPADAVVSLATGRDCSVVRLDRGEEYCRAEEAPPEPPIFCTRSRGGVDCWTAREGAVATQRPLADGPIALTAAQEAHRTRRWPGLW